MTEETTEDRHTVVARRGAVLTVFFPQFGDKTLKEDFVQPVASKPRID